MKKILSLVLALTMLCCTCTAVAEEAPAVEKPRIIITQDAELDDKNSMIHVLLYADVIDLAGLIQTSSSLHYAGHDDVAPYRWPGTAWMDDILDAYEAVYPNLKVHSDYPTPEYIRSITKVGNITDNGEMELITEGSELIKNAILDDDPRTLYVAVGGGANTLGRALKSIEEEYRDTPEWDAIYEKVCNKVVMTSWGSQDVVYPEYISVVWPTIKNYDVSGVSGPYGYMNGKADVPMLAQKRMQGSWMYENLLHNHGPLMDLYITWGDGHYMEGEAEGDQFGTNEKMLGTANWWGAKYGGAVYYRYDFCSEGDSPNWMIVIPTGLRNLEDMSWGGWGGRYVAATPTGGRGATVQPNPDALFFAQPDGETTMAPFLYAIQGDFAARASWCTAATYAEANHQPSVTVAEALDQTAKAGDTVTLTISTSDPDGDEVIVSVWQYAEAGTYAGTVQPTYADGVATLVIPEDAQSGNTIHLIVEANDTGAHNLRAYARVVVTVE